MSSNDVIENTHIENDAPRKRWYIVQAFSGFERRVKETLEQRIAEKGLQDQFGAILVPTEEIVEMKKGGKKQRSERKFFPGYVLIEMVMNDETWYLVRKTPRVSGFIGGTNDKPTPLNEKEVVKIQEQMEQGADKPRPKIIFEPGEVVRVIDGPFKDFNGVVEEVNYEKSRLRVAVLIFGRSTPVELEFSQVEKG
jgi:transcriptional antiterminator NusG